MADWPYNTRTWRRLRAAKLSTDPMYYACEMRGRLVLAVAVDHVVAIKRGGAPFPPLDGLMSLCEPRHNEKTATLDCGAGRTTADGHAARSKAPAAGDDRRRRVAGRPPGGGGSKV